MSPEVEALLKNHEALVASCLEIAAPFMEGNDPSHDLHHVRRVLRNALAIYAAEVAHLFPTDTQAGREEFERRLICVATLPDCVDKKYVTSDAYAGVRADFQTRACTTLKITPAEMAEIMEIIEGSCHIKLPGQEPRAYSAGESFNVPADSWFDIETRETLHYVCHFG